MKKIMIVDDAAFIRKVIRRILEKAGYEVIAEAENGRVAVEKYQQRKADLVILDIVMPEMDGVECLKALKKIDSRVNVIMCSTVEDPKIVADVYHLGVHDFVAKPIVEGRLLDSVSAALERNKGI